MATFLADSVAPETDRRRWLALAAIVTAQFMVVLDVAIVNVALPTIKTDLHFSQESLQWVITAYAILFGGALLLGGRLADIIGRRRMFMAGIAVFAGSSLLAGLAWSESSLIIFRILEGFGGALLSPAALSILTTTFAEGRERNIALGVWGGASGSGAAAGVLLGGVLTSYLNWSWIFFINVPIGSLLILVTPWLIRESKAQLGHRKFDIAGATTITSGLMLLVYAMTYATQHGWATAQTIGLLVAAAALVVSFVVIELRSKAPLLPMRIFRMRSLTGANVASLLMAGALFSMFFLLTLYMQEVLHYSAIKTGVAYIAVTLTVVVFSVVGQALITRLGVRQILPVGLVMSAGSLVLYARLPVTGHYFFDLFPAFILSGVGLALAFVAVSIGGLSGIHPRDAGIASGLLNTTQQVGGAIGLAAATTISTISTNHFVQGHAGSFVVTSAALVHGFGVAFYVLAVVALLGAGLSVVLIEPATSAARQVAEDLEPVLAEAGGTVTDL
jgi:EmrB/QacA subfamily drug resistance transporter